MWQRTIPHAYEGGNLPRVPSCRVIDELSYLFRTIVFRTITSSAIPELVLRHVALHRCPHTDPHPAAGDLAALRMRPGCAVSPVNTRRRAPVIVATGTRTGVAARAFGAPMTSAHTSV